MNRLSTELQRLYARTDPRSGDTSPSAPDDSTRCLILQLGAPAAWAPVSRLWRALQTDLGLPAPAIAINGSDGYQLWLSLQQAVSVDQAQQFLARLCQRYLADVPARRLLCWPGSSVANPAPTPSVPAPLDNGDRWSAYVAPDLAPVFEEAPYLDLPPGDDGQADLLAALRSIAPSQWTQAMQALAPVDTEHASARSPLGEAGAHSPASAATNTPRQFLWAVMQDESVALSLRIEAAKALLPYS